MSLRTRFLRDARGVILGAVVEGYSDGSQQIRNKFGQIVGKTIPNVGTKNQNNQIVARTPDPGFLFNFGYSTEADDE